MASGGGVAWGADWTVGAGGGGRRGRGRLGGRRRRCRRRRRLGVLLALALVGRGGRRRLGRGRGVALVLGRAAAEERRAARRADRAARDQLGHREQDRDGGEGRQARGQGELPLAPGQRLAAVQRGGRPRRLRQRLELLGRRRRERVERVVVAVQHVGGAAYGARRDRAHRVDGALEDLGDHGDDDRRHRGGEHRARPPQHRDHDRRDGARGAGDQERLDGQAVLRALLTHAPPR